MQQIELVSRLKTLLNLKNNSALFIAKVADNSPVQKSGLLDGDIITKLNDKLIETADTLYKELSEDKIGMFQFITIIRNNQLIELKITPVEKR
jgi:S1-C subfamily serine protease